MLAYRSGNSRASSSEGAATQPLTHELGPRRPPPGAANASSIAPSIAPSIASSMAFLQRHGLAARI